MAPAGDSLMISDKSIPGEIVRDDLGGNEQAVPPRMPEGFQGDVSIAKITPSEMRGSFAARETVPVDRHILRISHPQERPSP